MLTLSRYPKYRWVKYAGNWKPHGEPWSCNLQRCWLEHRLHRGTVTVNGRWPGQPSHVYSFLNPSLSESDIQTGQIAAREKQLSPPYRLIFVGRLEMIKVWQSFAYCRSTKTARDSVYRRSDWRWSGASGVRKMEPGTWFDLADILLRLDSPAKVGRLLRPRPLLHYAYHCIRRLA